VALFAARRHPAEPEFRLEIQFAAGQAHRSGHDAQCHEAQLALVILHVAEHLAREAGKFGEFLKGEPEPLTVAADDAGQRPVDQPAEMGRQGLELSHQHNPKRGEHDKRTGFRPPEFLCENESTNCRRLSESARHGARSAATSWHKQESI